MGGMSRILTLALARPLGVPAALWAWSDFRIGVNSLNNLVPDLGLMPKNLSDFLHIKKEAFG